MDADYFQKIKAVFAKASELPVENRAAFLKENYGDETSLIAEVNSLLDAHDEPENLIEKNALSFNQKISFDAENLFEKNYVGKQFGHYKILREIGRGGMGAVFLATRSDGEFKRNVALKIVRQTIFDSETEKLFRRERDILASLNHPNIAQLHDGGVSDAGETFLVMEFVLGETLLEFAEKQNLSVEEKLKLFLKICSAVSYAHRNLTIHRDLKPTNILVTSDGEPKLLDFGLAKILDESIADQDQTVTVFRAFTPAYASPEQILGKKVTTTSDVYSLGVVFYELLTDEKPFRFEGKSIEEIIDTINHSEPSAPSAVLNSGSKVSDKTNRKLNSDLDNIALKSLQKNSELRYQSVEEFAADIKRHLNGLPILARPATAFYRASKFFRRNKIALSAAALILLSMIIGGAVAIVQFRKAQAESAKNKEVRELLQKMLIPANPEASKGYSASVNDLLEQMTKKLESEDFSRQPEVKAELERIIGNIYNNQGQYELGEKHLRAALKLNVEIYGENSFPVLLTKLNLANLQAAKADYDEAEKFYEQNLSALREQNRLGNLDNADLVKALNDYAVIRRARGDSRQAEMLFRENLELSLKIESAEITQNFLRTMIALTQFDQGKFDEAENEMQNLISAIRQLSNSDGDFANALTLLGSIQMEKGDLNSASQNLRDAEALYRKLLSPNSLKIFDNLRLQAQVSYLEKNYPQAEKQIGAVLENYRQNANPKYISYATALTLQGLILSKLGRGAEAENILREAVRLRTENLPPKHFLTALTKGALGEVLTANKKYAEAESLLLESREDLRNLQAAENQRTLLAENRLLKLYRNWKNR